MYKQNLALNYPERMVRHTKTNQVTGIPLLFDPQHPTRDEINVMYHGQVMLVPVLRFKNSDHVTLSKLAATR